MLFEKLFGVLAALADALAFPREPRAALLQNVVLGGEIEHIAFAADAFAVHDVELDLAERWRQLVLDHLDARAVADHLLAVFERADTADVHAHAGVELERVAAGGGLWISEHHADL